MTYKSAMNMQSQLQLGKRVKEKGNMVRANERGSTKADYSRGPVNEEDIEWWEGEGACTGEAAEVPVFKHGVAGGLGSWFASQSCRTFA